MRKIICSLLVFVVLAASCHAEIDLSSYTYDDLCELRDKVVSEISFIQYGIRVPESDRLLTAGVYSVGRDIDPGTYVLSCENLINATDPAYVWSYRSLADYNSSVMNYSGFCNLIPGQVTLSFGLTLEEGMLVVVYNGLVLFRRCVD